ncbi:hypothetical protein BH11ARM2_BH11ARM2_32400 [soil metagenome]
MSFRPWIKNHRQDIDAEVDSHISRQRTDFDRREASWQKEVEDQAQAVTQAKTAFLASMSHEIRTPLNGILGIAEMLLEADLEPRQREYVNLIRVSGDTILGVVSNVLDVAHIQAGNLDLELLEFDFAEMCEEVAASLALRVYGKGVELIVSAPADFPTKLIGDESRLRQVVTNLVGNAAKFTDEGEIVIVISQVGETDHGVRVRVEVVDTGIGIPQERQAAVFQTFTQADQATHNKYGGTGLGLSISKGLVETMGGEIGLESEPHVGSKFWFEVELQKTIGR